LRETYAHIETPHTEVVQAAETPRQSSEPRDHLDGMSRRLIAANGLV